MNIVITGSSGFLGKPLTLSLAANPYCQLYCLVRETSNTFEFRSFNNIHLIKNNEAGFSLINSISSTIDYVIHIATNYGRPPSSLLDVFDANVHFPVKLLKCFDDLSRLVFINTDTYFNTDNPFSYLGSYILSKKHFIDWLKLLSKEQGLTVCNMKLEHIYGPNDSKQKFIPWLISECKKGSGLLSLTSCNQKRDFIYIEDVISSYLCIVHDFPGHLTSHFREFGVGTGLSTPLRDFVEIVHSLTNSSRLLGFGQLPTRDNEIMDSFADNQSLKELGWSPVYDLEHGIVNCI